MASRNGPLCLQLNCMGWGEVICKQGVYLSVICVAMHYCYMLNTFAGINFPIL